MLQLKRGGGKHSDEFKCDLAEGFVGGAEVMHGGEVLNIDEVATLRVSGAVVVLGVRIWAGVLDIGSEGLISPGNPDLSVLVLFLPGALGLILGIEEGNDGGGPDLFKAEFLTVGEHSGPSAAIILTALVLVGCIFVIAARGVRLVPGHLSGLGEGSNDEGGSEDNFCNHF